MLYLSSSGNSVVYQDLAVSTGMDRDAQATTITFFFFFFLTVNDKSSTITNIKVSMHDK